MSLNEILDIVGVPQVEDLLRADTRYGSRNYFDGTDSWITPPQLIKSLGEFDLDPCASNPQPFKTAKEMWNNDGLIKQWFGRVWLNPPYGNIRPFIDLFCQHKNGIALTFASTGVRWFFEFWKHADALLFLAGRLSFYTPDGVLTTGKPAANVLVAIGPENVRALEQCGWEGCLVVSPRYLAGKRLN
jgi:hypothetical protein